MAQKRTKKRRKGLRDESRSPECNTDYVFSSSRCGKSNANVLGMRTYNTRQPKNVATMGRAADVLASKYRVHKTTTNPIGHSIESGATQGTISIRSFLSSSEAFSKVPLCHPV